MDPVIFKDLTARLERTGRDKVDSKPPRILIHAMMADKINIFGPKT